MNLADNPLLARLKAEARDTFLNDVVRVERPGAKTLVDGLEVTGLALVWEGPARLQNGGRNQEVVEFPADSFQAQTGDLVTWVTCSNPALEGLVVSLTPGGQASAGGVYRVNCERTK